MSSTPAPAPAPSASSSLSAANLASLGTSSRKLGGSATAPSVDGSSQTGSRATANNGLLNKFFSRSGKAEAHDEKSSQAASSPELGKKNSSWFAGFGLVNEEEEEEPDDLSSRPDVDDCETIEEKFRAIELARLRTLKKRGQMAQFWEERVRKFDKMPLPEKAVQDQAVLDRIAAAEERAQRLLDDTPIDPYAKESSQFAVSDGGKPATEKGKGFDQSTVIGRRLNQARLAGYSDDIIRDMQLVLTVQEDVRKADAAKFSIQTVRGVMKRPIPAPKLSPASF